MSVDLDAIRAIIDAYEARKKNAREWHIKNDVPADEDHLSRLATFNTNEAFKAFEALRPLVERVRELEGQRDWLVRQRRWLSHEIIRERIRIDDSKALFTTVEEWIRAAEQAAKEAGE